MKYSYKWLQSHIEQKLPEPIVLVDKIIFNAFEVESTENKNDDTIFDIKVLPDRAGDCLSHLGMAREIAGMINLTIKKNEESIFLNTIKVFDVKIETPLCRFYSLTKIENVSPQLQPYIKEYLKNIGTQVINDIVDVGNYLMFDQGQPVHIFDADTIVGAVTIRNSIEGEVFVTLQNEEIKIPPQSVIVTDEKGIIALAGIKGGARTMVTNQTKNILIEIANFDPVAVRITARRTSMLTDASKRFENNFPVAVTFNNYKKYLSFFQKNLRGEVSSFFVKDLSEIEEKHVTFSSSDINNKLGVQLPVEEIATVLKQRGFNFSLQENSFVVSIPEYRNDLSMSSDFVEEIGKTYGYDKIPTQKLSLNIPIQDDETFVKIQKVKDYFYTQGFVEVQTYSFRKKGDVAIAYGTKDKSFLRNNLSDGIKESLELNQKNSALLGLDKIKLFEIGTVFLSDREEIHIGEVSKNNISEYVLDDFSKEHPEGVQTLLFVTNQNFEKFKLWSVYPYIVRDLAVWTKESDLEILRIITKKFSATYCIVPARAFDIFQKDGRMSVAYRFVFQSFDKTLTDKDVEIWWQKLIEVIHKTELFDIR